MKPRTKSGKDKNKKGLKEVYYTSKSRKDKGVKKLSE